MTSTMKGRHAFAAFALCLTASLPGLARGHGTEQEAPPRPAGADVVLTHVHGLAFSGDGTRLYIPDHRGIAVYAAGRWTNLPGSRDDFMGFTATRGALYSSGHPAPAPGAVNPLGLVKSTDGGQTWRALGLRGEADFHLMAGGYRSRAVYVIAEAPNSRMPEPGLYVTTNDGLMWKHAASQALDTRVASLAAHPTQPGTVAVAARSGLYLSTDGGDSFRQISNDAQGLSVAFDLDGKHLWYGSHDGQAHLTRLALLAGGEAPQSLPLPPLHDDAVAYIAQSPANPREIAIATFRRSVYLSGDGGKTWRQIAEGGATG